jgi:hypothetical protein
MLQAVQGEASRVQGSPPLSFSSGQHNLALLYLIDSLCSQGKGPQRSLNEKLRMKVRTLFARILPALVQQLATPCNCDKVLSLCQQLCLRHLVESCNKHHHILRALFNLCHALVLS